MSDPHTFAAIPSPSFVVEERKFLTNLRLIREVSQKAEVDIILALKAFALWPLFPVVKEYLAGATASSLNEARLIYEEMGTKAHTYAPVYIPAELSDILQLSSHITFNSLAEYERHHDQAKQAGVSMGLRVNPEYSEVETEMYNPAGPHSRLGETSPNLPDQLPADIEGLHFHVLCESSSHALEKVLQHFERRFGKYLSTCKWVNFGGGHLMTRADYDITHLITVLQAFKSRYPHLKVILEPGSAIAWQTGILRAQVLDIIENNGVKTAILDVSFTAHMPDTLEMPYRPRITGATDPKAGQPTYRLGGVSCLAGDYLGEYSFARELQVGDPLILEDMIHYTMVKTTMFNGVKHPDIGIIREDGRYELLRSFTYADYKSRLG